jgi:hypothetical protein
MLNAASQHVEEQWGRWHRRKKVSKGAQLPPSKATLIWSSPMIMNRNQSKLRQPKRRKKTHKDTDNFLSR